MEAMLNWLYAWGGIQPIKPAEFSRLVSAMGCPQEQRLFVNIYRCLQIWRPFSSTMTLWYCNSLFCLRPSKKYCTNNTEILGVREIKDSIESMWLESFNLCIQKSMHFFNLNVRSPLSNLVYICLTEVNEKLSPIYFLLLEKKK